MGSKEKLEEILDTARNYAQKGNVDLANQTLKYAAWYGSNNKLPVITRIRKIRHYMDRNMVEFSLGYGRLYYTKKCYALAEAWFEEAVKYARKLKQKNIKERINKIKSKPLD